MYFPAPGQTFEYNDKIIQFTKNKYRSIEVLSVVENEGDNRQFKPGNILESNDNKLVPKIKIKLYDTKYKITGHQFREIRDLWFDYENGGDMLPECDNMCTFWKAFTLSSFSIMTGPLFLLFLFGAYMSLYWTPRYVGKYVYHNFKYSRQSDHRFGAENRITSSGERKERYLMSLLLIRLNLNI